MAVRKRNYLAPHLWEKDGKIPYFSEPVLAIISGDPSPLLYLPTNAGVIEICRLIHIL